MGKYFARYLIFWLPAVIVYYLLGLVFADAAFFSNGTGKLMSHVLQWFFAFFMVFGWATNTGMAAYHYPRSTLAALLAYTGFNTLIIIAMYSTEPRDGLHILLRRVGGALSFLPLNRLVQALKSFSVQHEMVVLWFLVGCCVIGYLAGLVRRRVHPDPYSPRIRKA